MLVEAALLGGALGAYWRQRRYAKRPLAQVLAAPKAVTPAPFSGKRLLRDLQSSLFGDERQAQQLSLDPTFSADIEKQKREANRNMLWSAAATGMAVLASSYPVFWWFGAAAVLYLARDVFHMIWRDFKRRHFFSVYLIGALTVLGMLVTNNLLLAALSALIGGFLMRIVKRTEDRAQTQLTQVFSWHPGSVWVEKDGVEIQIPFASLGKGDLVIVSAGEVVPVDGLIVSGQASIDQQALTGESRPVERSEGERVFASTVMLAGRLKIRVDTAVEDTLAANIAQVLANTQSYKDSVMARGQQIADRLLPVEAGLGAATWLWAGTVPALAVMWSYLGANMVVLGPLTVLNYLHILSRQGILVKDGRVFESLRQVDTVVFDKTGTLTLAQPELARIHAFGEHGEEAILRFAAAAEHRQTHPVAKAILDRAAQEALVLPRVQEASYQVGFGIEVRAEGRLVQVGSARYMEQLGLALPAAAAPVREQAEAVGYSLVYVAIDRRVAGLLELRPSPRPEAAGLVRHLRQRGLKLCIISGDHEQPTRHLAESLGIEQYFAEVLPEDKAGLISQLGNEGRFVCFVGDGINDAIALKTAQVSISLKGASSAATDTAQIVFMDGNLERLPALLELSDEFEGTMRGNLLGSVVPGVINIASVFFLHTGIATGMAIYYAGSLMGLGTSLSPLIQHQNRSRVHVGTVDSAASKELTGPY